MLAFTIFITHGLACYVAIDITWNEYLAKRFPKYTNFWEYVTRTLLVFVTCELHFWWRKLFRFYFCFRDIVLLAVAIPNIELFISLFGALCLSALGLAFPAMIQTCVFWNQTKGWKKAIMVVRNVIITFAAVVGLVSGTTQSIIEIVHTFFK